MEGVAGRFECRAYEVKLLAVVDDWKCDRSKEQLEGALSDLHISHAWL